MNLPKDVFDRELLTLAKTGKIFFNRHAHPIQMNEKEKSEMIPDGEGNYYVVAVIREESQMAPLVPEPEAVVAGRCRGVENVYPEGTKKTAMSAAIMTAEDVSPKPVKKIEQNEPKPSGRGRPAVPEHLKRVRVAGRYRLPQWLMDWLQKEGDAGRKIEHALIAQYGLKPPGES
ncbi:MAG: hypothetical protein HY881_20880 [Deltaproteobacteria bacterium]|nr:hypothetical protein [Deltaproteobacteria bacterium]